MRTDEPDQPLIQEPALSDTPPDTTAEQQPFEDNTSQEEEIHITTQEPEQPAPSSASSPDFSVPPAPTPQADKDSNMQTPDSDTAMDQHTDSMAQMTPQKTIPALTPDIPVTKDFITDLALYAATAYHPARTRTNPTDQPIINLGFKQLNMRYGVHLTGLDHMAEDKIEARKKLLDVMMSPTILNIAHTMYAQAFIRELLKQAKLQTRDFRQGNTVTTRTLNTAQVHEMVHLYATKIHDSGACFSAVASHPTLLKTMNQYFHAVQQADEAFIAYHEAEAAGAGTQELETLAKEIKKTILAKEYLQANILIWGNPKTSSLSQGEVLEIASWVYRRIQERPDNIAAIKSIAHLADKLAGSLFDAIQEPAPPAQP